MTKLIKITSVVAAILLFIGTYFKHMHWMGANVLLIAGAAAGILLFIAMIVGISSRLPGSMEKVSVIIASITLVFGLLAFMFKMLHWPGAAKLTWAADIGILLTAVFFLIDAWFEKASAKQSLKVIIAFFALLLFLIIMLSK